MSGREIILDREMVATRQCNAMCDVRCDVVHLHMWKSLAARATVLRLGGVVSVCIVVAVSHRGGTEHERE